MPQCRTYHTGQFLVTDTIESLPDQALYSHILIKNISATAVVRVFNPTNDGNYLELDPRQELKLEVPNANLVRLSSPDDDAKICWVGH